MPFFLMAIPQAKATLYVDWRLDTTEKGEFVTAFAHLYGVPQVEKEYELYFCEVELDATEISVAEEGIIEVSVGEYAQPAREVYEISERGIFTYGLNPTFNDKVAEVTTPTPVTVDLKMTDKAGNQIYADSITIQMLPISYYAWVLSETDMRVLSPVLATPHADPIQKLLSAAAKATPFDSMLGYQEYPGYSHEEIVEYQMRAIYNVLQNLEIVYVHSPRTFTSTEAQRIRLPVQTLNDRAGNCIELSLLFCSIFEAMDFRTEFVYLPQHVFITVYTWPDSDIVFPLETTFLGTESYDKAREFGLNEYNNASQAGSQSYIFSTNDVRIIGITPTPYMDKMPTETKFYEKVEEVSKEIFTADETFDKLNSLKANATINGTLPIRVEELYNEAEEFFYAGNFGKAENYAAECINLIAQPEIQTPVTPKPSVSGDETIDTIIGFIFVLMPVALVILGILYIRARRKRKETKVIEPVAISTHTPAKTRYCGDCGKEIPTRAPFCRYCGEGEKK